MFGVQAILSTFVLAAIPSSHDATLLFATTPGCGPCRQVAPLVEELARQGYSVETIDASKHPDIIRELKIDRFPTLLMLSGETIVDRVVGGGDPVVMKPRIFQMFQRAEEIRRKSVDSRIAAPSFVPAAPAPQSASLAPMTSQHPLSATAPAHSDHPGLVSSVKLRVDAENAHSWGTGTIIDARNGEALILTCGHIFRDSKGQGQIEVHLYGQGSSAKVYGRCIHYDLEIDLALIVIEPPCPVRATPVAPAAYQVRPDQQVWSVGCDGGANPTVRDHKILSTDRIGTPLDNALPFHYIQISGAPVSGRSGGGLFSENGYLIGVCNTADPVENDGHFVPPRIIRQLLQGMRLAHVYENPSLGNAPGSAVAVASAVASAPEQSVAETAEALHSQNSQSEVSDWSSVPLQPLQSSSVSGLSDVEQATLDEIKRRTQDGDEVILIVRSRRHPEIPSDVIVLNGTSGQFLDALARGNSTFEPRSYNSVILSSHEPSTVPATFPAPVPTASGPQAVSFPVFH